MIRVKVRRDSIEMSGHAPNPAGSGQNIVCAAVSALTLTLIEGILTFTDMDPEVETGKGLVRLKWTHTTEQGKLLIDTWILGILGIQRSYNNTITLE